ncbi:MAG: hypothetical protein GXO65_04105 [Euryarchaeota archaeon]|nr:hypothetical protein [Euryarchaeota archaeon]
MAEDYFLEKLEARLSEILSDDMAHHLIAAHFSGMARIDGETAYRIILGMIPDIIAQVGLDEGLRIGQEIKDIYNQEFF